MRWRNHTHGRRGTFKSSGVSEVQSEKIMWAAKGQREWAVGGIRRGLGVKDSCLRDNPGNNRAGNAEWDGKRRILKSAQEGIMAQRETGQGIDPDHVTGEWGGKAWIPGTMGGKELWSAVD